MNDIVNWHEVPALIVSDRDACFTFRFWQKLQEALGTNLYFTTAFHPQMDGQSERTIQTLEDMLKSYVLQFNRSWDSLLPLAKFTYNNNYHSSIGMTLFEVLYGMQCRTPLCQDEIGERRMIGSEYVQMTINKIKIICDRLKLTQDRQKSYTNVRQKDLEFKVSN